MSDACTTEAVHEAGHAIMCMELGITFDHLTIEKIDNTDGHILTHQAWHELLVSDRTEIAISLGGLVAEQKIAPQEDALNGFRDDLVDICGLFLKKHKGTPQDLEILIDEVRLVVEEVIEARRLELEHVARTLMQRKTLSYWDVVWILRDFKENANSQ